MPSAADVDNLKLEGLDYVFDTLSELGKPPASFCARRADT